MNPKLPAPTARGFRRRKPNLSYNGHPPTGLPSPECIDGLHSWITAEGSVREKPVLGFTEASVASLAALRVNPYLRDVGGKMGAFFQSGASLQCYFDGNVPSNDNDSGPVLYYPGGGGSGCVPVAPFTIDRRASAIFVIGEQLVARPGQGSDNYFQSSDNAQWGIDSVTRRMLMPSGVGGVVSSTMKVYSRRCLMGWVHDSHESRFHLNDQIEVAAALTAGEVGVKFWPGLPTQAVAIKDWMIYNRAPGIDEVYRTLLPYAIRRGVTVDYDSTLIWDGDSITAGFKSSTGRGYTRRTDLSGRVRYVNLGLSGITMATLDTDFALKPQIYIPTTNPTKTAGSIFGGTNDIANSGATAAATYASLTSWVNKFRAVSAAHKLIAVTPLPRTDNTAGENTILATYRGLITGNAAGLDYVFDTQTVPALTDATNRRYFFSDGIHLTDEGEQRFGEAYEATVKAALAA